MPSLINFLIFWALMTYSISMGDLFAMFLCCSGFLIMMGFIEDIDME